MATFTGTAGDDKIKGTTDADTLIGLAGNDSYTVDHTDDVVTEVPGEGTDTITTSVTYDLADEVENLVLTGTASLDAKANDLDNAITGNSGGNHLYTLDGVDTVIAGLGDDTVEAGAFLAADDRFDGGAGVDRLRLDGDYSGGLTLNATTVVNFEKISLADGNSYDITLDDATNSSSLSVKGNRLTTGSLNLDGSAETKSSLTAFGGGADDTLIGGAGADTLHGGGGADIVTGGAGIDTASYALSKSGVTVDLTDNLNNAGGDAAGDTLTAIENLTGSDFGDSLTGDNNANVLDGGSGDDTLTAGAGNDKILGGGGLDLLVLDTNLTTADTVDGGDDYDTLRIGGDFSAGFTLGKNVVNIEEVDLTDGDSYKFTLTATANNSTLLIDGTALTGTNRVIVNGAAETIHSLTAFGGEGNDSLVGGSVADTLSGGIDGNDTVMGGGGDDVIDQGSGLNALDKVDGGAGKDTLFLSGDYSGGVIFSATTVTGVETILLDGGFGYDLTLNNNTNKATLLVDGRTNNAGPMVVNGASETSNSFTMLGGDSDDKLVAGGGADLLIGGAGADTLTGGGGLLDTASYAASAGGVNVNLTTGAGTGNDAQGDVLSGIEHVIGTDFDDSLTGSSAANKLIGGFGNDTLAGGTGGNDLLDGGEDDDVFVMGAGMTAADTLIGGNSNDTLQLAGNYAGGLTFGAKTATSIETILLAAGNSYKLTLNDETAGLTLTVNGAALGAGNFLQFNGAAEKSSSLTVTGGAGNDVLTGGASDDKLTGNGGNDALNGGEGDDTLDGGAGNDKLTAGNGANSLTGGIGLDTLIGGADNDMIAGGDDNDSLSGGAGVNNMKGEAGNDTIVGGAALDTLDGGDGNDSLSGGGGNNLFNGGVGADAIVGGAGIDTATYAGSALAVTVDLTSTKAQVSTGDASGDVLTGVENVIGSAQNDTLIGSTGNNSLQGAGGFDKLSGGLGNDTLDGGAISDVLDGGAGIDLAGYASSGKAVSIDLALAIQVSGGDATGDQYTSIEGVVGSNFDDTLIGNGGANSIDGGAGDDRIVMGANLTAADSIDGGADVDTLVLDGNYATGLAFAATTMKNVEIVSLTGGNNYKLTLTDANNTDTLTVDGSGLGTNTLFLTASAETKNALTAMGADGNDTLIGGGGNDTLAGGAGADKLTGNGGSDTADYSFSVDAVTVDLASTKAQVSTGDANGDILMGIEGLVGSIFGDLLKGSSAANSLVGGDGDDTMIGGAGADTLDGGPGPDNDTADYSASKSAIAINFGDGTGSGGDAAGDKLTGLETVVGSKFNDSFIEDGEKHTVEGGLGTDLVDYSFSTDAVQVDLAGGGPNAGGFADGDVLVDVESVIGTAKDDTILGSTAGNRLVGGEGNDTLDAGGSDDTLQGGKGEDFITVGDSLTAKDQIDGGTDDPDNLSAEHDKLEISGDYSAGVILAATTIQNIEEIVLKDGFDYVFTANNATNSNKVLIDASELKTGSSLNFNASAETSHSYVFRTGADADTITGGAGKDTLDFSSKAITSAVVANLTDSTLNNGFALGDVYAKIDNIRGSDFDDELTGDKGNNILEGGLGDDIITGGAGNDTLAGGVNLLGADSDRLVGDDGFDVFDGGEGIDSITFEAAAGAVTVDLLLGNGDGAALGDIYSGIENVVGTRFDDVIVGDASNNRIEGGKGLDTLTGDLGADTLIGGEGADTFSETSFTSKDRIEGGDEVDDPDSDLDFEGDTLQLMGDAFANGLVFTAAMAKGIEKIEVFGGESYSLTLDNSTNSSTMIVDASSLGDFNSLTLNASKETSNSFTVFGGLGGDTIIGGAASDVLVGNFGADSLVGGKGSDTAGYQNSFEAVTVDLNLKTAQLGTGGDDATGDILVSIENLRGTDFDDTLIGDKNGNILEGGKGNDTLDGGLGTDVASYEHDDSAVQINLLDPTKNTGAAAGDVYSSIEGAIGTQKDDTIVGNGSANYIAGGKGDDTLVSGHGNDTVLGGDGKDRIELGFSLNALDKIDGGEDDDIVVLNGNYSTNVTLGATTLVNVETLELTAGNNYRITLNDGNNTTGLIIDGKALQEDEVMVINGAAEKSSRLEIYGGADNDSLTGGGGGDKFRGGVGNDLLVGNAGDDDLDGEDGNDSIVGGIGSDNIAGGAGIDTMLGGVGDDQFLMLGNLTASDRIDGGTEADTLVLDGDYSKGVVFGALTMLNVEAIQLTAGNSYELVMHQNTNGGTLRLDAGSLGSGDFVNFNGSLENKDSFIITSGAGDDTIIVGAGSDTVDGGDGADTMNGGAGIDTISYLRSASGVTVDLTDNSKNAGGDAAGDVLSNFENIVGSAQDDSLTGNSLANLIIGGAGGDFIDGGLGVDTVTYIDSKFTVFVDLDNGFGFGGDASGDSFANIENVIGTDIAVDKNGNEVGDDLIGNGAANLLDGLQGRDFLAGLGGNDTLLGGFGHDTLEGGLGADILDGSAGDDWISYENSFGAVTVDLRITTKGQTSGGEANGDLITGVENIRGSDFNDRLTGDSAWNDFEGGKGADTITGGGGADASNYFDSGAAVQVSLAIVGPQNSTGDANGDVLIDINNLRGSQFNDRLTGDNLGNGFFGWLGNDTITGGGGRDMFEFNSDGEGVDLITDFTIGKNFQGDFLQIVDVLDEDAFDISRINDFARIVPGSGNAQFQVNADGAGDDWVTIAVLQGISGFGMTAQDMLDNGNLQVTGEA